MHSHGECYAVYNVHVHVHVCMCITSTLVTYGGWGGGGQASMCQMFLPHMHAQGVKQSVLSAVSCLSLS